MRRAGILGLAIIATLGLAVAGTQAAKPKKVKVRTDATVDPKPTNSPTTGFVIHGEISSGKGRCVRGRTVELHRILFDKDEVVGTDEAAADGSWEVDVGGLLWQTDYYALAERTKHRKKHKRKLICKTGRSPNTYVAAAP
jgi:hypothetical protein